MDQKEVLATFSALESTNTPTNSAPDGIRITLTPDDHQEEMNHLDAAEILDDPETGPTSISQSRMNQNSDMRLSPPPFRALFDESHHIAPSPLYASMMTVTGDVGRDVGNTSPHEPPYGTFSTAGSLLSTGSLSMGTSSAVMSIEQYVGSNSGTRGIFHPSAITTTISQFATSERISTMNNILIPEVNNASTSRLQSRPPELEIIEENIDDNEILKVDTEQVNQQFTEPISETIEARSDQSIDPVLPNDEASLRRIILHIQTNTSLSCRDKAKKIQQLMMSRWISKRDSGVSSRNIVKSLLSEELNVKSENTHRDLSSQSPPWLMLATMSAPNLLHDMNPTTEQNHNDTMLNQVSINRVNEIDKVNSLTDFKNEMTSHSEYIERVIRPMLTQQDLVSTIAPVHSHSQERKFETFGCKHYTSGCKIFTPCCMRWFPCRYCHDEATHISTEDSDNNRERYSSVNQHSLPRFSSKNHPIVKYIMCQNCQQIQLSSMVECTKCGLQFGSHYTCTKCVIWENDPKKRIYHCHNCQLCRIGDQDEYFHCTKCDCCLRVDLRGNHKCIEKNLHCDCPICGEYLFYSTTSIIFMPCGHAIHYLCHQKHTSNSYQCPICWKSLVNMKVYFARLDQMLSEHRMPEEYASVMSNILCNDCEKKSSAHYHFMYHKCRHCGSYNTKLLSTFIQDQKFIQSHEQDIIMDTHDTNDQYPGENIAP